MTSSSRLQEEAKRELARRELARRHLRYFADYTYDDYLEGWHTILLCEALERVLAGEIRNLLIEAPPRHSKSVHVSQLFPAFAAGKNPDLSFIVSSYSGDLATDHGRETRNLIDSDRYQHLFKTRLAPDSKAKGKWNTQKWVPPTDGQEGQWKNAKGAYNAVGVGGSTTGKGADIAIVDDSLKDRKEAESQLIRDGIWSWFRAVMRTRLSPTGSLIVMGTRWHLDDLAGRIMEQDPWVDYFDFLKNGLGEAKWVRLRLMAIAEEDQEPFRRVGEALWPERYPLSELEDIKRTIGPYEWEALYQQRPISSETQEFKPAWYRYRTHTEVEALTRKHRTLTIDTAASKNAAADFTGFCDNLVADDNTWNIKAWKLKIAPDQLIELLFSLHLANKYDRIGIEEGMYTLVLKPFLDRAQRERGVFLPIVPLKHNSTQKEVRIRGLIPPYAAETIYHIEGECSELEFEQAAFPNGKHDDVLDATAYQPQILQGISGGAIFM
ncbi:terminase large subunit domain-containing protein [Palleronia sp. KMU-117]|uniref:terminase large subunit domain-containing protein n=1 Tax=Palleronia sp. KMU-117 TaxID=3434108 RepID=UPI003D760296